MGGCNPAKQVLTPAQIYTVAVKAGFSATQAVIATAVALAESGGDAYSYNCHPPDDSYGLWQVNMIGTLGPSRRQWFGIASNDELYDPQTNANAAYAVFKAAGHNFSPWTTYTSGAYKSNLQVAEGAEGSNVGYTGTDPVAGLRKEIEDAYAQGKISKAEYDKAIQNLPASASGVTTPGLGVSVPGVSWLTSLGKLLGNLLDPRFWLRIGQGFVAGILLLMGAGLVFRRDAMSIVKGAALA